MRRIALWFAATAAVVVLLFTYRTSTSGPAGDPASSAVGESGSIVSTGPPTVVDGPRARTRWGPVQVEVTITDRKIIDVSVLVQPDGNSTDRAINAAALPRLRQQVLAAQDGRIDGVSGATVTSDGYRQSLQAALDAVHFGQ